MLDGADREELSVGKGIYLHLWNPSVYEKSSPAWQRKISADSSGLKGMGTRDFNTRPTWPLICGELAPQFGHNSGPFIMKHSKLTYLSCTDEHVKESFCDENWISSPINPVERLLLFSMSFRSSPGVADKTHRTFLCGPEGLQILLLNVWQLLLKPKDTRVAPQRWLAMEWQKIGLCVKIQSNFQSQVEYIMCVGFLLWKIQYAETTIALW